MYLSDGRGTGPSEKAVAAGSTPEIERGGGTHERGSNPRRSLQYDAVSWLTRGTAGPSPAACERGCRLTNRCSGQAREAVEELRLSAWRDASALEQVSRILSRPLSFSVRRMHTFPVMRRFRHAPSLRVGCCKGQGKSAEARR
jgi:hypothetical protein